MVRPAAPATFAVLFCLSGLARAQTPPPAQRAQIYSPYETETIAAALARFHEKIDPTPEGKIVERVDVVTLDVIEQRDPLPNWLNVFHATTRPSIVRRELLVQEGDPYRQGLVDETIRNLRQLPPLSLVLVVATAGTRPDRVGLLVITKDVWSLRANWDVNLTSGGLELLEIDPEERNLFGRHQDVSASFVLQPSAYTVGAGYTVERLGSSRVAVVTDANVMINRASGSPEGSFGSLVAGQPLYSALTEWAWDGTTSWQDIEVRRYVNAQPSVFLDTTTGMSVPFQYRERQFVELLNVRRSFGSETKHDLLFGLGINRTEFSTDFPGASPRTVADFEATYVPNSDTRVGPTIQYETYEKRYVRVIDFDTLALQEDYRLGHDIVVKLSPSFRALGASENLLSIGASAQYTFALRDGLFRLGVATLTEPTIDSILLRGVRAAVRVPGHAEHRRRRPLRVRRLRHGHLAKLAERHVLPRGRRSPPRLPHELLRRAEPGLVQPRVPVAARRDPVLPARRRRLLRRGRRDEELVDVPAVPVRRRGHPGALPAARPGGLPRRPRRAARAPVQRVDERVGPARRLLLLVRPGPRRAERRAGAGPPHRAGREPGPGRLSGPGLPEGGRALSRRRRSWLRRARRRRAPRRPRRGRRTPPR